MKKVLLTVGNGMMGDDGAGALLAQVAREAGLADWEIIHGGSAPENVLHKVRAHAPDMVMVVDAADMDLAPGCVRRIGDQLLENPFMFTTHTLPLTFLMEALREFVPQVEMLGIQPELVAFGMPISPVVRGAVMDVFEGLKNGNGQWENL